MAKQAASRRAVGVGKVELSDHRHIVVHRDEKMYLYATNRGGIWNFGDGEIAVAYLAVPMGYDVMGRGSRHWATCGCCRPWSPQRS